MPLREQIDFDSLLADFLDRDPIVLDQFPCLVAPRLKKLVRRLARGLPPDVLEEVVQEAFFGLLTTRPGNNFDPARGGSWNFLFGVVLNAAQRVRASYRPPGVARRMHRECQASSSVSIATEPFDETVHSELAEKRTDEFQRFETAHDLERVLAGASTLVAAALVGLYIEGQKLQDVAKRLGVSRFLVSRHIKAFLARSRRAFQIDSRRICWRSIPQRIR